MPRGRSHTAPCAYGSTPRRPRRSPRFRSPRRARRRDHRQAPASVLVRSRTRTCTRRPAARRAFSSSSAPLQKDDSRQSIENAQNGRQHRHRPLAQGNRMERVEQLQHPSAMSTHPSVSRLLANASATMTRPRRMLRLPIIRTRDRSDFGRICPSQLVEEPRHRQSSQLEPPKNGKSQGNTRGHSHAAQDTSSPARDSPHVRHGRIRRTDVACRHLPARRDIS